MPPAPVSRYPWGIGQRHSAVLNAPAADQAFSCCTTMVLHKMAKALDLKTVKEEPFYCSRLFIQFYAFNIEKEIGGDRKQWLASHAFTKGKPFIWCILLSSLGDQAHSNANIM